MTSLGTLLRSYRERLGLSQVEVETATGITQGHISAIERGARSPSLDVLQKLASAYKLGSDDLADVGRAALSEGGSDAVDGAPA